MIGDITIGNGDRWNFIRTYIGQGMDVGGVLALNFEKKFAWYLLSSIFYISEIDWDFIRKSRMIFLRRKES